MKGDGTIKVPSVTIISEGLLKDITSLQPDHQHELVSDLIAGEITKAKSKTCGTIKSYICNFFRYTPCLV